MPLRVRPCGRAMRWCLPGPHHRRVVRHLRNAIREVPGYERQDVWVVVVEVVAPAERVVHAPAVGGAEVALVVAGGAAEQIDLILRLAAVLPGQHTARRD